MKLTLEMIPERIIVKSHPLWDIIIDERQRSNFRSLEHVAKGNEYILMANGPEGRMYDTKYGSTTLQGAMILAEGIIKKDDCWMTAGERRIKIVKLRSK